MMTDRVGNPFLDEQFYAEQENENWQHEVQLFWDITDELEFNRRSYLNTTMKLIKI